MDYYPTRKRLFTAWIGLLGLTLATAFAGGAAGSGRLGVGMTAALFLVTSVKAGAILRVYLNLRTAPVWADLLTALVGILLAMILAIYILVP